MAVRSVLSLPRMICSMSLQFYSNARALTHTHSFSNKELYIYPVLLPKQCTLFRQLSNRVVFKEP